MHSAYIDYVIGIFMFLFEVNFNLDHLILIGHVGEALRSEELRWYLIITGVSTALIAADIYEIFGSVGDSGKVRVLPGHDGHVDDRLRDERL